MELNNIQELQGPWRAGWALDLHTISSIPVGLNSFDTKRTYLGELLYRLKYCKDNSKTTIIAEIVVDFLKPKLDTLQLAVFIPIPPSDMTRKSQPVYDMAKIIAKNINIDIDNDYLLKTKSTSQLKSINDPNERRKILTDVFKVKDKNYEEKNVLLFDDLYRSGATLSAATQALINDGHVANVYVLVITKTRSKK